MLFAGTCTMQAQTEETITVTDANGNTEEIDLPESMTQELDSLMSLYNAKTYLKLDVDCNMPNVNPVYDNETYKKRLAQLPTVIEMPYNDIVQKFINRYSGDLRRSVSYMLGAQNFYMPIFEEALETYGLPLELKYLPVIESALNPKAVSRVGATGLWQFMLTTGKQYGLEVNSLIDERCDPVKASYAAARYLSDLYKIYKDWNLVIAAYNCGPDNINKAIHRTQGERDYWKIYPYLPHETRGYVPAFIAANYIMNYYCEHNICPLVTTLPAKTDTVMLTRDVHFNQIAHVTGVSVEEIENLNPQYRRNLINAYGKSASLRLPVDALNTFIDNEDEVYAFNVDQYLTKRTEVDVVDVGNYQVSRSPVAKTKRSKSTSSSRSKRSSRRSRTRSKSVTVRSGDTLSQIAARNNTTTKKLKQLNGIKGNTIQAGKKLKVK